MIYLACSLFDDILLVTKKSAILLTDYSNYPYPLSIIIHHLLITFIYSLNVGSSSWILDSSFFLALAILSLITGYGNTRTLLSFIVW